MNKMLIKLLTKYYNFKNVFNRFKTNKLFFYRSYNYKIGLKNENKLRYNKIYFMFENKLQKIKIYLNLKKNL